ncbi:MAG: 30S ribosomal protein S17e [Candidatus Lokiarchaeota archaeon]|nr:30S ribosomal protein S17e [Candidatus Lokiarchaeota archaeon]
MGRVRPVFIKKISKELIEKYPNVFSNIFEENKKLLDEFLVLQSKVVRNRIAGYITHLIKNERIENEFS